MHNNSTDSSGFDKVAGNQGCDNVKVNLLFDLVVSLDESVNFHVMALGNGCN